MITSTLMGGLGNQLFQIFSTIAYAIRCRHKFIFPYCDFLNGITTRGTYWETFLSSLKIFTTYNTKYGLTNDSLNTFPEISIPFHNYQEIPMVESSKSVKLFGYFQSYKYFEKEEETIFSLIRIDQQLSQVKKENKILFEKNKYNISMHFRLGDYKFIQESHNILPYHYYELALHTLTETLPNENINVFVFGESADNETILAMVEQLKQKYPLIHFIKIDDIIPDWKQLLIMACCESNIIANSSFSWWGAYFNKNKEKRVCYPSVWFGPHLSHNYTGDMFPDSWTQIFI